MPFAVEMALKVQSLPEAQHCRLALPCLEFTSDMSPFLSG